jgi:hypothetical protein
MNCTQQPVKQVLSLKREKNSGLLEHEIEIITDRDAPYRPRIRDGLGAQAA